MSDTPLFLFIQLEVKDPEKWSHVKEETQVPEESGPKEPLTVTGVRTNLHCAKPERA